MKRWSVVVMSSLGLAGLLGAALLLWAYGPAKEAQAVKPSGQRDLQGEDARRAAELEKERDRLRAAGRFEEALKVAEAVETLRARVQGTDHWQTVNAHAEVEAIRRALGAKEAAEALVAKGRHHEAQPLLEQALALKRQTLGEQHPDTAACYNSLALNLQALGRYPEAAEGFRKALAIRRQVLGEEDPYTGQSYFNVAYNLNAQGRYADAEGNYRKALAIWRKVPGEKDPLTATSYNDLAQDLEAQGRYAEAEPCYRKALAIRRQVLGEEHSQTAACYNNLAANLHEQGRYAEAEPVYRRALALQRKALGEAHPNTAACYNNLAQNLRAQGNYAEAAEGYHKALALCRKLLGEQHPYTAICYNNLALNLEAQGKYPEAEPVHRKALAIWQQALGEESARTAAGSHNLAANLHAQGKYAEAEPGYHKALAVWQQALGEEHPRTATGYRSLAANFNARGQYAEAERFWALGADAFARARLHLGASGLARATKTAEQSPLPSLAAVLARNGKPDDAWQRFEESLARGTWDDLSARLRRPPAEQARQTQLVGRIERLDKLIQNLTSVKEPTPQQKKQREELLTQLRQAQDELADFTRQLEKTYGPVAGQVSERGQIQAALTAGTALLGWLDIPGKPQAADPNGEHWAVLLRGSGAPIWLRLRGSGENGAWTDADTQLPSELRTALQSPRGEWQTLAERLRQQRLQPLVKHLEGVRRLIVLPSTALAGVPVEAIAGGYTVSYAQSGSLYAYLRKQPAPTGKGLFVLADPVFEASDVVAKSPPTPADLPGARGDDGGWKRLPGTRAEAAALQRLFGGDEPAGVLLDSDASEQRLDALAQAGELGKYRYLHLATHGEVDNVMSLRSAVILARDRLPDDKQRTELLLAGRPVADGRLTAEEVLRRWNLNCDLVTLSACQTALGKYEGGEGFVGFAQAFVLSGSRSVCLSLWSVDDTATTLFMERFYQNLLGKREGLTAPLGKAAALAEAKTWLRQLPRSEAGQRAAKLREGAARGKRPVLRPTTEVAPTAATSAKDDRPYAHPYYWSAFVLLGDPE